MVTYWVMSGEIFDVGVWTHMSAIYIVLYMDQKINS